jgi:hypothetical protein
VIPASFRLQYKTFSLLTMRKFGCAYLPNLLDLLFSNYTEIWFRVPAKFTGPFFTNYVKIWFHIPADFTNLFILTVSKIDFAYPPTLPNFIFTNYICRNLVSHTRQLYQTFSY